MLGEQAGWGYSEELLATVVDWLAVLDWHLRQAHFKGPHERPEPVLRPGDGGQPERVELDEPPRMSTPEEIRAFFGASMRYSES